MSAGRTISELLRCSRFDVLPLDGIEDEVREHLATDVKVTVAASPRRGLEATLELSERLAAAGYPVVPHLSARLVRDRAHLEEVLARLEAAGVRELYVPAGDATEPGELKIGMGESARFLRHNRNMLARVLTRQFKPTKLLDQLTPVVMDPAACVAGFHLFTFNEVGSTECWRQRTLSRLTIGDIQRPAGSRPVT